MVQKNQNIYPKIAVLGLNPYNAEFRKKNSEEMRIIIPAIKILKKGGLKIGWTVLLIYYFFKIIKNTMSSLACIMIKFLGNLKHCLNMMR